MVDIKLDNGLDKNLLIFPTTRYQGSKRRLAPWLYSIFDKMEFESVLDGFGGSASMSYLFKLMGKKVIFNDIMKSNFQSGVALIENNDITLDDGDINFLFSNNGTPSPTYIFDTFKDIYYYSEENAWLDNIVSNIGRLNSLYSNDTLKKKKALSFHSLFQACLSKRPFNLFHRKNLYLREANVKRSFGNKKTWDQDFTHLFRKFANEASSKVFSNNKENMAFCCDILHYENQPVDLIYLDPPYQRPGESKPKDYFSLYHFLEGIVDYDNWSTRIDYSKKHKPLRQESSSFDEFSLLDNIEALLMKFDTSKIALSYGYPGKPSISELRETISRFKSNVEVFETEFSYKLNKRNGRDLREVLIVGT
jgi:adenine-specific DNA methylase